MAADTLTGWHFLPNEVIDEIVHQLSDMDRNMVTYRLVSRQIDAYATPHAYKNLKITEPLIVAFACYQHALEVGQIDLDHVDLLSSSVFQALPSDTMFLITEVMWPKMIKYTKNVTISFPIESDQISGAARNFLWPLQKIEQLS